MIRNKLINCGQHEYSLPSTHSVQTEETINPEHAWRPVNFQWHIHFVAANILILEKYKLQNVNWEQHIDVFCMRND